MTGGIKALLLEIVRQVREDSIKKADRIYAMTEARQVDRTSGVALPSSRAFLAQHRDTLTKHLEAAGEKLWKRLRTEAESMGDPSAVTELRAEAEAALAEVADHCQALVLKHCPKNDPLRQRLSIEPGLEKAKQLLSARMEAVAHSRQAQRIESSEQTASARDQVPFKAKEHDYRSIRRRVIDELVAQDANNVEIVKRLDQVEALAGDPLLQKWQEEYDIVDWQEAYKHDDLKNRVQALISKRRRKAKP